MRRHLVVDISGHGYGHAGMTVPILNELRRRLTELHLTLRTTVPFSMLKERIEGPFDYIAREDFGMSMTDALYVSPARTLARYLELHANWKATLDASVNELLSLNPSLLLSNISYQSLAASSAAEIPSVAMSSLNWADVFSHYCRQLPGAAQIQQQMAQSYAAADLFLQLTPAMAMPSIKNARSIGPVALIGQDRKRELRDRLQLHDEQIVVLIALGGIPFELPVQAWPRLGNLFVLLASEHSPTHPDVRHASTLSFSFIDLIRSCDVLITKPGYGIVTEVACNATPTLLVPRNDWPEELPFRNWLSQNGRTLTLTEERLKGGSFCEEVQAVRSLPTPLTPVPTGIHEAARILENYLI